MRKGSGRRRGGLSGGQDKCRAAAIAVARTVRAGAVCYARSRHLPALIRATPDEIAGQDVATTQMIVARLTRALAAERRRGRCGHWTYDINRHIALMQALAAETDVLARIRDEDPPPRR